MNKRKKSKKSDGFTVPQATLDALQQINAKMLPSLELFKALDPILSVTNEQIRLIRQISSIIAPILTQNQKFIEFAQQVQKYEKAKREAMLESGWWITPSLKTIPASWISKAVKRYHSGEKAAIYHLFRSVYQKNNWNYLKPDLSDSSL